MLVPNRHGDSGKYRFGFGGMEKDDELKGDGNSYNFDMRLFDSRLGKFLTLDPEAVSYPGWGPYAYVRDNPILRIDPTGKWDVEVHVYKDRAKYGYGIAIVKDRNGKEVYRFKIRAEGTGGTDRLKKNANTPLGVYDIPDKGMWISGGARKSYGPNHRLVLTPESGEIADSGRADIRIHGGRQEVYNSESGQWEAVDNPQLKKTHGCMRSFDTDIKKMKEITDELQKNDSKESGGKLKVVEDLVEKDGGYVIPDEAPVAKPSEFKFDGPVLEIQKAVIDNTYVKPPQISKIALKKNNLKKSD